jgi:hypothetical protein
MIVKCISNYPTEDQLSRLGPKFFKEQDFHVTIGKEYVVFGLTTTVEPGYTGLGLSIEIVSDFEYLVSAPICLFEILEGTPSRFWELRVSDDNTILLWPRSFYREFYHDDLSNHTREIVEDFTHIRALIEAEAVGAGVDRLMR